MTVEEPRPIDFEELAGYTERLTAAEGELRTEQIAISGINTKLADIRSEYNETRQHAYEQLVGLQSLRWQDFKFVAERTAAALGDQDLLKSLSVGDLIVPGEIVLDGRTDRIKTIVEPPADEPKRAFFRFTNLNTASVYFNVWLQSNNGEMELVKLDSSIPVGRENVKNALDKILEDESADNRQIAGFYESSRLMDNYLAIGATDKAELCKQLAIESLRHKFDKGESLDVQALQFANQYAPDLFQQMYDKYSKSFGEEYCEEKRLVVYATKFAQVLSPDFLEAGPADRNIMVAEQYSALAKRAKELAAASASETVASEQPS